jgi:hypothetical protein
MKSRFTRRWLLAFPVALIADTQPQHLRESQRVGFTGVGPVRIGMTEKRVRAVLNDRVERTDLEADCSYLTLDASGIAFMLLNSRVARVDVTRGHWRTDSGAGIGTSETEIHRLYPRVRTEPHPYFSAGEGYYLRVSPSEPQLKNYELIFETEHGAVTSFRAGLSRAVALIEGCA